MVKPIATISVVPNLPTEIQRLEELAYNLRWAWDHDTIDLFRRLDRDLWKSTYHNPVLALGTIEQDKLEAAKDDPSFMAHYQRVCERFDRYMEASSTWYKEQYGDRTPQPRIAYFSMEFGITECLQNYSGGLGLLSGDHLKSASDLGVPLVAIGLLYQEGYFRQYLNADGFQQELYPVIDYSRQPVQLQRDAHGDPIIIHVPMPGRQLAAQIWKAQVGRVALYLLDSNVPENTLPEDRVLTAQLYGGDKRTRIRQEILMGIGGIRALETLGLRPDICHMNEGHSAFLALERTRMFMLEHKVSFHQAKVIMAASHLFTTHTPVPAGLERFGFDLIDEHFTDYYQSLGLTRDQFIDLGREEMGGYELFSMAVLAINLSSGANGVAQLHGVVSREMWQWMYPSVPKKEIPIGAITNGVHVQTWVSREMGQLLDRYLDPAWRSEEWRPKIWESIDLVPDSELWRAHERRRERLVTFTRERLQQQLIHRGAPQHELREAESVLNPEALTFGFARRFATYKRATLLFRDPERLARILNHGERPLQIIFAGKAHPHDVPGKDLIREIAHLAHQPEFRKHVVFLEDYDIQIARYLIQGVDVWLNTPRRPKEASGTSGMKVIYNGGLNCSILDGWWAEGYHPDVGWAIGAGEEYAEGQEDLQDQIESQALYNLLEQDIIPTFYERPRDSVPHNWMAKVKSGYKRLAPVFNTDRMVQQYTEEMYMPAYERETALSEPTIQAGLDFAAWMTELHDSWKNVQIGEVKVDHKQILVGAQLDVDVTVSLGTLTPEDVQIQLYYGPLGKNSEIGSDADCMVMTMVGRNADNSYHYHAQITYNTSGERGLSVRALPKNTYLPSPFVPGMIRWAQ